MTDCIVNMEMDTSAAMCLMSQSTFQGLWPGRDLSPSQVTLEPTQRNQFLLWDVATSICGTTTIHTPAFVACEWFKPTLLGRANPSCPLSASPSLLSSSFQISARHSPGLPSQDRGRARCGPHIQPSKVSPLCPEG